ANQQRRKEGAGDRAEATHHHDHEGVRDEGQIDLEIGWLPRDRERAAEPGEQRTQGENRRKEQALVYAEGGGHLAVLGRCADEDAPPRFREDEMKRGEYERP